MKRSVTKKDSASYAQQQFTESLRESSSNIEPSAPPQTSKTLGSNPFSTSTMVIGGAVLPSKDQANYKLFDWAFTPGAYQIAASKGSGKTIFGLALALGAQEQYDTGYIYHYEPRAICPETQENAQLVKLFSSPKGYLKQLEQVFVGRKGFLILDSVTDPLTAAATDFVGQSTSPGGYQPSAGTFVKELDALARNRDSVIIYTLNSNLVPYFATLGGAIEGEIAINANGTASVLDRTGASKRKMRPLMIGKRFLDQAVQLLGLGDSFVSSESSSSSVYDSVG